MRPGKGIGEFPGGRGWSPLGVRVETKLPRGYGTDELDIGKVVNGDIMVS